MKALTATDILYQLMNGHGDWEYHCPITKGRRKGWVEIKVTNIPDWPGTSVTRIVVSPEDYRKLLKKKGE